MRGANTSAGAERYGAEQDSQAEAMGVWPLSEEEKPGGRNGLKIQKAAGGPGGDRSWWRSGHTDKLDKCEHNCIGRWGSSERSPPGHREMGIFRAEPTWASGDGDLRSGAHLGIGRWGSSERSPPGHREMGIFRAEPTWASGDRDLRSGAHLGVGRWGSSEQSPPGRREMGVFGAEPTWASGDGGLRSGAHLGRDFMGAVCTGAGHLHGLQCMVLSGTPSGEGIDSKGITAVPRTHGTGDRLSAACGEGTLVPNTQLSGWGEGSSVGALLQPRQHVGACGEVRGSSQVPSG
ncbi:hypothetical protein P7K49_029954 [Saguinus oedipus]|uniref:Uncharacterized protein n=1 Tax=Saguinus oedipus TaxID=9490 RepID=A0ABQ9U8P3_SAGOE|nr:hypothetical protein P7K49_029954 [Saguinus oedipus]